MFTRIAATLAFALLAGPAASTTFTFFGTVTDSPGPAATSDDPDFPPIGEQGRIELTIYDFDPTALFSDLFAESRPIASAELVVPGYLGGVTDFFFISDGFFDESGLGFSNTAFFDV